MDVGGHRDFEFVGGPYDGKVLPVAEDGDGLPEIFVVPNVWDEGGWPDRPPSVDEHRYERDGDVYRYLGEAKPDPA